MSKIVKADQLYEAVLNVKRGFVNAKEGMIESGKWLMVINQKKLWKADGSPSKSFSHWVENELGISKSTAHNLMSAYEKVGELIEGNKDFIDIDMSKIFLLLPYIGPEASVSDKEELLHMAQSSTWRGLNDNLRELKGKKATDTCDHDEVETLERCKRCGKWLRD